jgi:Domain of unknown function (DUF1707)/Cell wall-active antibiotics response 4TMS YvqF
MAASVISRLMSQDEPDAAPQVRAADRDRDVTLELLSTAVGDGRLTLEEYSGRADRALAARLVDELTELTADLNHASQVVAPAPVEMVAILSNESLKGQWTVPAHVKARTVLGDCHIELQQANLTSHVTVIEAKATLGSVTIFVPEGVEVRMSGKSILGNRSSEVRTAALPGSPVIEVRATAILGNVTVQPAKLTQRIRDVLNSL